MRQMDQGSDAQESIHLHLFFLPENETCLLQSEHLIRTHNLDAYANTHIRNLDSADRT